MAKRLWRQIKAIESREKKGPYGRWRQRFCGEYRDLLVQLRNRSHCALVNMVATRGGRITCQKGCTHCCFHYVTVSLAHGIVIVEYLYKREALLEQFIDNYEKWRRQGLFISESLDHARIQAKSSPVTTEQVIAATRPLSERYFKMNIPCPFLSDGRCIIYDVRPIICSGHYAVSPPPWCAATSRHRPQIHHLTPADEDLLQMMKLADPRLVLHERTLPKAIYALLTEGASDAISAMAPIG